MKQSLCRGIVVLGILLSPAAGWGTTLKDYASNPVWIEDADTLDHFLDPDPGWAAAGAAAIVGNGEELSRVGIVWGQGSLEGGWDEGDINEIQYRFRFFANPNDFSLEAMYDDPPYTNWGAVFMTPANEDWSTPVGSTWHPCTLYYSEVDVSSLHIATVPGQTHLVVLVPESKLSSPTTITVIALSRGGEDAIGPLADWYTSGVYLNDDPPGPLTGMFYPSNYFAYRVTAEPAAAYPPADFNQDSHVDATDFDTFSACYNGPTNTVSGDCLNADFNNDYYVDATDFDIFSGCYNGPVNPPGCS